MNIFILDKNPKIAAEYHCDKHVVKMILESAQMLSTTHWLQSLQMFNKELSDFKRVRDSKEFLDLNLRESLKPPYKMTHVRHPCTIWTTESIENYVWHVKLLHYLCKEYTERYGRIHKTAYYIKWFVNNKPYNIPKTEMTPFKICMADEYKVSDNPVDCYKEYYIKDKSRFAKWKLGNIPQWYLNGLADTCKLNNNKI
jgi:hypothetical protein